MKISPTYNGCNLQGYHVFTCMVGGSLRTYRVSGYTVREAKREAREYFANLKD